MVLIDNPNLAALEVLIDGELVGKVGAESTGRFGPLPRGDHKVVTRYRCNKRHLTYRTSRDFVEVRKRRPARIDIPFVRKGIVDVGNGWIQPMKVLVDGRSVGTVRAGGTLGAFAGRGSTVELRDPQGNLGMRTRMSLQGLEIAPLDLDPAPIGSVTIVNPAYKPVRISTRGADSVRIRPGRAETLTLPTGWTKVVATHRGRTIDTMKVLVSPFARGEYVVQVPTTGDLRFRNDDRFGVQVFSPDGRLLANVRAGDTAVIRDLPVGECTLEVVAQLRRRTLRKKVAVSIDAFEGGWVASNMAVRDGRGRYASYSETSYESDSGSCDRTSRRSTRRRGYERRHRSYAGR